MASFNTIKSIRNLPLLRNVWHTPPKSFVPKTSEFKYLPELSGDVFQLSSKVESGLELSKNSLVFDDVLLNYNTGKMASAINFSLQSSKNLYLNSLATVSVFLTFLGKVSE